MNGRRSQSARTATATRPEALLRALFLSDLADSTALAERLGDHAVAELICRHDRMMREIMQRHGGREVDKTDGFLVLFERPIYAVAFALEYQRKLREFAEIVGQPISARVGIHFGEVIVWENAPEDVATGAKPLEVEGLAKPIAARLMALALPGQILVSAVANSLAQRAKIESGERLEAIRWIAHGSYHINGVPEPITVFEVGEPGIAPLRAPSTSGKAWRVKPPWRRPRPLIFGSLTLLIAAGAAVYVVTLSEPALGFGERDWIVIGDLHNFNADKTLDVTLSTAFRIGIEESRYVNVVSDLAVRQALGRMQRDPTTRVDRAVGSEIAVREQARALLLPSIAQYGQKLRLAAELVDPNSTRTVSTQTADADGPSDILPAVDRLLRGVRTRLGESLKQIQTSAQPLDKVTTPNLEALRAFARGLEVLRDGDFGQAAKLFKYATELDPSFAMAYARMGVAQFSEERYAEARTALNSALAIEGRLSERERVYVQGVLAYYADPQTMLDSWRMFANLYPDQNTGQHNVGSIYYYFLLDYPNAEDALTRATSIHDPLQNYTLQTLAHVMLAEEKVGQADQQFRAAQLLASTPALFGLSDALLAGGRVAEATRYLDETKKQPPYFEIERAMRRATLLIASGDTDGAAAAIAVALMEADKLPFPNARWRAQNALIAIRAAQHNPTEAQNIARGVLAETSATAVAPQVNLQSFEHALYAASWAARLGLMKEARQTLDLAKQRGSIDRFPVRAQLATLVEAELELGAGKAREAADRLASIGGQSLLWEAHEARARALRAAGDDAGELVELRWLASHPGLAYAQWIDQLLGQQARALALQDAISRLPAGKRRDTADTATQPGERFDAAAKCELTPIAGQPQRACK